MSEAVTTGHFIPDYEHLLTQIDDTYTDGRIRATQAVNTELIQTYWRIGRHIVEFEQDGKARADYGKALLGRLAKDLSLRHGRGFSRANLVYMRLFYASYSGDGISQTLSDLLSWSHIVELLKIDDLLERGFYEQQTIRERWSVRELVRQKASSLFLRLAASKDKAGILQLAAQGQIVEQPADLLREPYVFGFLKIPEPHQISEPSSKPSSATTCNHFCWNSVRASRLSAGNTGSRSTTATTRLIWSSITGSCAALC